MQRSSLPLLLLLALACCGGLRAAAGITVPGYADARIGSPRVVVAPDRADWTYALGAPVRFSIGVYYDGQPLRGARVRYEVGPEKFLGAPVEAVLADGTLELAGGTLETPGFLRCRVTAEIEGRRYDGLATVAFAPAEIVPTQVEPGDFDAFWAEKMAPLAEIPLAVEKTLVPEACTAEVKVSRLSYQSWGAGGPTRFYGILTEPSRPGKYPAVLRVPGAGVRPYSGEIALAAKGVIVLQIGIHGIPVHHPQPLYDDLRNGVLRSYWSFNLDDPDRYFYRRVYLGCVRGNDVLIQHPSWDGKNLVVAGGSQGGQLAIVTAALDRRVTALVANYPAYSDVTGYLHGRAGGWPHLFRGEDYRRPENIATTAYYDAVNFARRLRVPGSYAWGFNDVTTPPTSMFAAYNVIDAPKALHLQFEMGHSQTPEFAARYEERILEMARASFRVNSD